MSLLTSLNSRLQFTLVDPHLEVDRDVDVNQPLENRRPGGLGLFLVQKSVDKVDYAWTNSRNCYLLWMRLAEPAIEEA